MVKIALQSTGRYFGQPIVLACDGRCDKAWGINTRPHIYLSCDEDDTAFFADSELDAAPSDPGTYEGDEARPEQLPERHNKWCARECERCIMKGPGEPLVLRDFSQRIYNFHKRQHDPSLTDYTVKGHGLNYHDDTVDRTWYVSASDNDEAMVIAQWLVDLWLKPGATLTLIEGVVTDADKE